MEREGKLQKTIASSIEYAGTALHSGEVVQIKCLPAAANQGIIFRRLDLKQQVEIKVEPSKVVSTRRCTSIGIEGDDATYIHTIEHLMAALWAMEIDNIIIEIDGSEPPVGDGSALPFIEMLKKVGLRKLSLPRKTFVIQKPLWVRKDDMYIVVLPYNGFKVSYTLDYDHPVIGTQFFEFEKSRSDFIKEIAPARTYGFEKEVKALHRMGLALGGSLENAVLIGEDKIINSLRFPDEIVRHKVLDVVGDMALNGYIDGHIIAVKSGHALHVKLAQAIKREIGELCELRV